VRKQPQQRAIFSRLCNQLPHPPLARLQRFKRSPLAPTRLTAHPSCSTPEVVVVVWVVVVVVVEAGKSSSGRRQSSMVGGTVL